MVVLGSRFPQRLCLNQDQLKDYVAGTEEMKRDKEEVSRICTSVDGCAWNWPGADWISSVVHVERDQVESQRDPQQHEQR